MRDDNSKYSNKVKTGIEMEEIEKQKHSTEKVLSNSGFEVIELNGAKRLSDSEKGISGDELVIESLAEDLVDIPQIVRETVPLQDDPDIHIVTFRYFLLSVIFIIPGAFLDTMSTYRSTSAAYSILFVQIACHECGKFLAEVLPTREMRLPGGYKFSLNPGPWSIKEAVLVTITASSGASASSATSPLSLAEIYYKDRVDWVVAIFFMWAVSFSGYAFAALPRNLLLFDPTYIWPEALMQTNLFQSQAKSDENSENSRVASKQMRVFFLVLIGTTLWQFLPEFVFPFLLSLAFLCWVAPHNATANFIGSGLGGMGFLNLTLDWSNITSQIMLYPYFIQVVQFLAFVLSAWILIPSVKWGNLDSYKHGLMSNGMFTANGSKYPSAKLLTRDLKLNETAYETYGPVYVGAQRAWHMFFDYASYVSGIVWLVVFGGKQISASFHKFKESYNMKESKHASINFQYNDRINKMQSKYEQVPLWWYGVLFSATFVTLITIFATGSFFIPWWTYIVALGFGFIIVVPLCWLYALTNFQLLVGSFNELLYGYMVQHLEKRHPAGAATYGALAGDIFFRARYMLQDQKIGHYMQLPPKVVFFSQLFGELIGVPINYVTMRWIMSTKMEYLNGTKKDPGNQWTGQKQQIYQTNAIQYVVLGPTRTFKLYPVLPYGFLVGFFAPIILGILYRVTRNTRFRKLKFHLWNTTVFFCTASTFFGNVSTGYFSKFIGGTVVMFWAYRYKHALWRRYNYILAAAFDTGYNLTMLLIFLFFSAGKQITMPHWWGNNADSVERCFAKT